MIIRYHLSSYIARLWQFRFLFRFNVSAQILETILLRMLTFVERRIFKWTTDSLNQCVSEGPSIVSKDVSPSA